MKRLHILVACVLCTIAADAQTIGDAFYIYRNDHYVNAFLREEVDSIVYSCYDEDGNLYDDVISQIVYTEDSTYIIPLAIIDSVSFIQPNPIFYEGIRELTDDVQKYITNVQGLTLTFRTDTPQEVLPEKGDKLAALYYSQNLPDGFMGTVSSVSYENDGIKVDCDTLLFMDAVKRFYGVYKVLLKDNEDEGDVGVKGQAGLPSIPLSPYSKEIKTGWIPLIGEAGLSALVQSDMVDVGLKGNFGFKGRCKAIISHRAEITVDPFLNIIPCVNLEMNIRKFNAEGMLDLVGRINGDVKVPTPLTGEVPIIPGLLTGYASAGLRLSGDFRVGAGSDFSFSGSMKMHYFIPLTLPFTRALPPFVTVQDFKIDETSSIDYRYFVASGELKGPLFLEAGLALGKKEIVRLGVEFEMGQKLSCDMKIRTDLFDASHNNSSFYETYKDLWNIKLTPFGGVYLVGGVLYDFFNFRGGFQGELPDKTSTLYMFPEFVNTDIKRISGAQTSALVHANIQRKCLLPFKVGFSIFDHKGNLIETQWKDDHNYFWLSPFSFNEYSKTFADLSKSKSYKVYPAFQFLGHTVLASPSASLPAEIPVKLSDFKVTKSFYLQEGFRYDGRKYDYKYYASVKATLLDDEGVADWGYIYEDPLGDEAKVSLKDFGKSYVDKRYAYCRDEAPSIARLYGYVLYEGEEEPCYGEVHEFPLTYKEEPLCPDNNHPHMVDFGTGVKWACCNVGASKPEDYGGHYAWGESGEKDYYGASTYQYVTVHDTPEDMALDEYFSYWHDYIVTGTEVGYRPLDIGDDICGTSYDVATNQMGGSWRMPTEKEAEALIYDKILDDPDAAYGKTKINGVEGMMIIDSKCNRLFFPFAGFYGAFESQDGNSIVYDEGIGSATGLWTGSTVDSDYSEMYGCGSPHGYCYILNGLKNGIRIDGLYRFYGISVRAVCNN